MKTPIKSAEKLRSQLQAAAASAPTVVPRLVTHSSKLTEGTTLVITPIGPRDPRFPGACDCVGAHLLPLGQKLDCVTNAVHVPVLKLVRHKLGADGGRAELAGMEDDESAATERDIFDDAVQGAVGLEDAIAALERGDAVSDFVPPTLPQLLLPDGAGYLAITPLACGAVQAVLREKIAAFDDIEWERNKADPDHHRRQVPSTPWQQAISKIQNLSSSARHRAKGALHARPPVATSSMRTTLAFLHDPIRGLERVSRELLQRDPRYTRAHRLLVDLLTEGFARDGTTKRADAIEDGALLHVFRPLTQRLAREYEATRLPRPAATAVASGLAQWLEWVFKPVSSITLRRWRLLALPLAEASFPATEGDEAATS